jgi:hypothetical protein
MPGGQPEFPSTPIGRQAQWYVDQMRANAAGLTEAEVSEHMRLAPPWVPASAIARFAEDDGRPYRISRLVHVSPVELGVVLDYDDGRPFRLTLEVEPDPPHRIVRTWWGRDLPDDIVLRQATAADSAALNDLEVRAPMTLGSETTTTVVYDRGGDFLAFSRLMDENVTFVADRGGELLGVACGAAHDVRIGGQRHRVMLLHHLRVPVEYRKLGVFSTLNGYVFGHYDGRTDGAYGYTALDNAEAMRIGGPGTWDTAVFRLVVPVAALAGAGAPSADARVATPDDAARIVEILNRCHDREEMFLPYTVDSFVERLARDPSLYSWDRILVNDDAVLGVWPAGLTVTIDAGGGDGPSRSVRAVALDHGFLPSAGEDAFRALLAEAGRSLAEAGHTEVVFALSEASPAHPVISGLASRIEPFAFRMAVPEPPGTPSRGVYVDPVYF